MRRSAIRPASALLLLAFLAPLSGPRAQAASQPLAPILIGGTYDPAVPTPDSILGYPIGSYHTDYAGLERWLDALRASPRVRILRYGESVERRPLYLVVISSPENLARLDEVKAAMRTLADPRTTSDDEARRIAATMPAVAWMNHANDGNESAAFESAIQTMWQLAAGTDSATRLILDRLVTIVNPAHNPESHERFVAWYNSAQVGSRGTADHAAAEHDAPWGMNTNNNHYQIDLNRDAFFVSQPETRAIVRAFGEWNPVVFVDHHGQTKNMFFPPPTEAVNLNVTAGQREWMNRYGEVIADAFDERGWSYYRRGRFDLFYAGFWDSWPTLNGSIGLTFETDGGGSKGLAWEREDETILTLRDGVAHHHTGTMAVLRLTARDKERRLLDFYDYKKSAVAEGARGEMRQVVLLPGADRARADSLVRVLRDQRIEVWRTTAPMRLSRTRSYMGGASAAARDIPAGAYVIPMAQPQGRLARALLELEPGFSPEFLRNEQRKKERAELVGRWSRDGFYDVTAWSLPLVFGVDAVWAEDAVPSRGLERVEDVTPAPVAPVARARYAYLFGPQSLASMGLVSRLLDEGFNIAVATRPFRVGGVDYPSGAIIARVERNPATLHDRIVALAAAAGVPLVALDGARVESGSDFGEDPVVELVRPRIAVVTDEPTDDRGYGATWFTLERRLGLPFTAIKGGSIAGADLSRYNVIVLPHGSPGAYRDVLGDAGVARLARWARDGGTLVLIKGAAAFATREGVEWTSAELERHRMPVRLWFDDASAAGGEAAGNGDEDAAPMREMELVRTPGAILRVRVDPEHFLGLGVNGDLGAMVQSSYAFSISRDGANVGAHPDESSLELAGFVWPEARAALARSLYLWEEPMGRGHAIFFADDPNFRATQLSTLRPFFNAVVLGPSFAR